MRRNHYKIITGFSEREFAVDTANIQCYKLHRITTKTYFLRMRYHITNYDHRNRALAISVTTWKAYALYCARVSLWSIVYTRQHKNTNLIIANLAALVSRYPLPLQNILLLPVSNRVTSRQSPKVSHSTATTLRCLSKQPTCNEPIMRIR